MILASRKMTGLEFGSEKAMRPAKLKKPHSSSRK